MAIAPCIRCLKKILKYKNYKKDLTNGYLCDILITTIKIGLIYDNEV